MESSNNQQPTNEQNPVPQAAPAAAQATPASAASEAPKHNVAMAVLAYIGPLVIVSYLTAKDDPFVKYHIKQGLVLLVIEIALYLIGTMMYVLWPLIQFVQIAVLIIAVVGIINAVKGKEKELPLVGKFAHHFKI